MRDYRRAGLELPHEQRAEVEPLRKEVARVAADFTSNVTAAKAPIPFTKAQLNGVPEDFLASIKTGEDQYTLLANVTFQFRMVMDNATSEEVRRQVVTVYNNLARKKNVPLLKQILQLRHAIAQKLGYASWADYQTEIKMAKTGTAARDFLEKLNVGLQPKFDSENNLFRELKARETGDANAKIHLWAVLYYNNQLKKENTPWIPKSCAPISPTNACSMACSPSTRTSSA